MARKTMEERFWSKVDRAGDGECWCWNGTKISGYGIVVLWIDKKRKHKRAHRLSYELNIGPIPEGMEVCHRCDNPPCVNPAHLFLGTHGDNVRDMHRKGRWNPGNRNGERNGRAKLTAANVKSIRRLREKGWTQQRIADKFGVSQPLVGLILRGKVWNAFDAGA